MRPANALPTIVALALSAAALAQPVPPAAPPPAQGPGLPASGPDQPTPQPSGTERATTGAAPEAAPLPPSVPKPLLSPGLARLEGKVTLSGLAPKPAPLPVSRDLKTCGATRPDETLLLGPGGALAQVVLSIAGFPPKARAAGQKPARVRLDQRGCQYVPHLIAVAAGAELEVVNSDPVLHNVHAREGEATAFNYAMPIKDYRIPHKLPRAQLLRLNCDVHPWMSAVVDVLDTTAFAVTDAQGSYFLDVPPGKYALKVWHEKLGERTIQVELAAGKTLRQDVALTPR